MIDYQKYKNLLEEEKKNLEEKILKIGKVDPTDPGGYRAVETKTFKGVNDEFDQAMELQNFAENHSLLEVYEASMKDIEKALEKIESQTYQKCDSCSLDISEDRLNAKPSSLVCRVCMEK